MHNLKIKHSHQRSWLYAISPKIKIYFIILWMILSFYYPLTIFWSFIFTLILFNFSLQFSIKTWLLHYSYTFQICLLNFIFCLFATLISPYSALQLSFFIQITQIKTNYKYLQYYFLIDQTYTQHFTNINTLTSGKILIPRLIFKQYIILVSYLYFCKLLGTTTYQEELIIAYLSLFILSKPDIINRLFFCLSITEKCKYLVLDKITNIICSIKFRRRNLYSLSPSYHYIHLIIIYLEIFINKLLAYSQTVSECLYSRELIIIENSYSNLIINNIN